MYMYATHRLMVIHPCVKYGKPMSKKKLWAGHENMSSNLKFDNQVKNQGRIWFMNVRDTLSHGDTPTCMCQIC